MNIEHKKGGKMKKVIAFVVPFLLLSLSLGFSQDGPDNNYGDYLLSKVSKRVSLDLEEANMVDALKMLSRQIGVNFVSTEAVKSRNITLYLKDVPVKEALDVIFKANNLAYEYYPDANIFVVKEMGKPTMELKTKVYYLKYTRVQSSNMQQEIGSKLGIERRAAVAVINSVSNVLSDYGKVTEDPLTNSLIVTDVPAQFALIDEVVAWLDHPQPQVMIEVEMLDVSKDLIDKLGVKFENGIIGQLTGANKATQIPFSKATGPTLAYGTLDFSALKVLFQMLTEDTTTKMLARPKILTLSNETAEVNLTADEVIGLSSTAISGEGSTQDIERSETGTKLRVTPQVNLETNEITLFVEVYNKEAFDSGENLEGINLQNVESRGAQSIVRLNDGETLLIGGLIKKDRREQITKVPFLADIPILGNLFRYTDENNEEREMLVFLTPRILKTKPSLMGGARSVAREQTSSPGALKEVLDRYSRL